MLCDGFDCSTETKRHRTPLTLLSLHTRVCNGRPGLYNGTISSQSPHTSLTLLSLQPPARHRIFFSRHPLAATMQFNGPTFRRPPTTPERQCGGVIVENELRVWAISRWRGPTELAHFFLSAGYRHLPRGSPRMFRLERYYDGNTDLEIGLYVHFTNPLDAFALLGQVFWCGCEFIAFTTYNIFTDFRAIFPSPGNMHTLPYRMPEDDDK